MLTPACPRASPISASAPGRFSSEIERSFIVFSFATVDSKHRPFRLLP
jgi:hypothetical protein